jgi:hypothetical protein
MLPVPAKSSETRAILLLISGHTEHLWIRIEIFFIRARTILKRAWLQIVAKQTSCATTRLFEIRSRNWLKNPKKIVRREYSKADVRELRAHSKARTPVDKIAKLTKRTVGSLRQKALKLGIGLGHQR